MKSTDLLQGDVGVAAYAVGFIASPVALALGGAYLGGAVIGWSILAWIFGGLGFVLGIAIGKYVAVGWMLGMFLGSIAFVIGIGIDKLAGWPEFTAASLCFFIVGGIGFLLGVIGTLAEDLKGDPAISTSSAAPAASGETPPPATSTGDVDATIAGQAAAHPVSTGDSVPGASVEPILVKPTSVAWILTGLLLVVSSPIPFICFVRYLPGTFYALFTGVPCLLIGIVVGIGICLTGRAEYRCPICRQQTMFQSDTECHECRKKKTIN